MHASWGRHSRRAHVSNADSTRRTCRGGGSPRREPRLADLDELGGRVLDLEGRVLQAETLSQEPLELAPDAVAVGPRLDEDVRREGRELGRHLPNVEVVHLDYAGMRRHR